MGNVVLRADTLSKRYTIAAGQLPYPTLRDSFAQAVRELDAKASPQPRRRWWHRLARNA